MIGAFVKRPAMTMILVAFFVTLGIVSYFDLFIELNPKVEFPMVTISTVYPGATPFEVETQVVKKIEERVAEISEIKKITSRSYESFGFILVEFIVGADANVKSVEIKDKIEPILNDLPDSAERPLVEKFDPLSTPVVELVLNSEKYDERELYEYADKKLKNRLSVIEGVASVDIFGGKERQINVMIDPELANRHFLAILDVVAAIGRRNINIPGGSIEKTEDAVSVRFVGEFSDIEEIKNMEVISRDGAGVKIGRIATVTDSHKEVEKIARYNGKETVSLAVNKATDGNTVAIGESIREVIPQIQEILPEGMFLDLATDNTEMILNETNDTVKNILLGILLTVIILYLFTGKFSVTFIASIVIPTAIVSTFLLIDNSGFTINFMTLLAIATSLGTLIANAIVIIESILAHLERGKSRIDSAIDGTKEVTVAVLAAAGTNLVVFTPIGFMGGLVGQFMRQFGLTVVYATIFSLIFSFTLTPTLCALMLRSKKNGTERKKRFNPFIWITNKAVNFLLAEYRKIFNLMFKIPKTWVLTMFAILFGSTMLLKYVGNEFIPPSDEDLIQIKVVMPQGSTIEKTLMTTTAIEGMLKKIPEVESYLTTIGENGVENATIKANLIDLKNRERGDMEIINELVPEVAMLPDAEIQLIRGQQEGGVQGDISIEIYGLDYDKMIALSRDMLNLMRDTGYFRSLTSSYKNPKDELLFIPDQEKVLREGISYAEVGATIRASIYGEDKNVFKEQGEEYPLNVEMDDFYKQTFQDIKRINVIGKKGLQPITEIGEVKRSKALPTIWRRDKQRVIQLDGYLSKSTAGEVQRLLDGSFKSLDFKKGYGYRYTGNAEFQEESERETSKAGILAVILTYMLLVAILNSFLHPFTIATSIVTSFSGVFLLLFFTGSSINIGSMFAMVMLIGLAVNNAILILDTTMRRQSEGYPIIESLWFGIEVKFKAVLMTSIAIIFGAAPQLTSAMGAKVSMGAVIVGGMTGSIVFTFLLIPIIYWYLERIKGFFMRTKA